MAALHLPTATNRRYGLNTSCGVASIFPLTFLAVYSISTGCSYKLSRINLLFGPLKCSKSNFNTVHVFLHFNSFCLVVLKLILASILSEVEQFENRAANYQLASIKGGNEAKKTNQCH